MCQLLETIKLNNGKLENISLHNSRINHTRAFLFQINNKIALENEIKIPNSIKKGIYKCRVIYKQNIESIEFSQYQIKPINKIKLIYDNDILYEFKYLERSCFTNYFHNLKEDDILIVKKGFITDVSFANIIFFDGEKWITPHLPLLKGTKRNYLLNQNLIFEAEIKPSDIKYFKKAKLINAMLELNSSPDIEINNIVT